MPEGLDAPELTARATLGNHAKLRRSSGLPGRLLLGSGLKTRRCGRFGYADHVYQPEVLAGSDADPFRQWSSDELIQAGVSRPLMFTPGTNWGCSHTGYMILGQVVERVTHRSLTVVMDDEVLRPTGLRRRWPTCPSAGSPSRW